MKKLLPITINIFILLIFALTFLISAAISPASALGRCNSQGIGLSFSPKSIVTDTDKLITFEVSGLNEDYRYYISLEAFAGGDPRSETKKFTEPSTTFTITIPRGSYLDRSVVLVRDTSNLPLNVGDDEVCEASEKLEVIKGTSQQCNIEVSPSPTDISTPINITVTNLEANTHYSISYRLGLAGQGGLEGVTTNSRGAATIKVGPVTNTGTLNIKILTPGQQGRVHCSTQIEVIEKISDDPYSPGPHLNCYSKYGKGLQTAIGCIPAEIGPFTQYVLTRAISIGGGIAFLLMLFGAFTLITSAGNPESTKKGQEIITSAVTGLLFIIFSVFLLKVIGIDILQLDQFGVFQ